MASDITVPGDPLPTEKDLLAAGDIEVLDESGKAVPFKSLYSDTSSRQLVVFIRHYYCNHCENFVMALSEDLPQSKLDTLSPPVKLSIIGCGEVSTVAEYKKRTNCKFPVYSNPDQALYKRFGMVEDLSLGSKAPDYIKIGFARSVMSSLFTVLSSGRQMLKGGDFKQNGGELFFEHGKLKWLHKMRNTRDHTEIPELEKVVGF